MALRFAALVSINQRTAAAPIVSAFHKSVSSLLSAHRRRLLYPPTQCGVAKTRRPTRSCTVHMGSLFHRVDAMHTLNSSSSSSQASMARRLKATSSSRRCIPNSRSKVVPAARCRRQILAMPAASAQTMSRTPRRCRLPIRLLKCHIVALVMGSIPTLTKLPVRPLFLLPRTLLRTPPHSTIPTKARAPLYLLIPAICSRVILSERAVVVLLQRSRTSAPPLTILCCNL